MKKAVLVIGGKGWSTCDPIKVRNIEQVGKFSFKANTSHWGSDVTFIIKEIVSNDKMIVHATMGKNISPRVGETSVLILKD
jgi:hypothetical protein